MKIIVIDCTLPTFAFVSQRDVTLNPYRTNVENRVSS